jgi:enoyl-CoA hydratase
VTPVELQRSGAIGIVTLGRGKVNAINDSLIASLEGTLDELRNDATIRAVVLAGEGKFFSFGFDIPELLPLSREECTRFLEHFTGFYTELFLYPKPVVAALNGHAIAGGCMLATACDRRIMASGKAKISLNEVTFGASVFAGSVEMLKACAGHRNAEEILLTGAMYSAEEAMRLGLVDRVTEPEAVLDASMQEARALAGGDPVAFKSLKKLLRGPIADEMRRREPESLREFVEIWYSEATRQKLKKIQIRA